jgi:H+/Cl- antiporter ClcA
LKPDQVILGAIGIVVIVIVLLAMTPTVVDQVQTMDTSGWNFTGHQGAALLLGLVPFIWIACVLVAAAVGMFALAQTGGGSRKDRD